MNSELKSFTLSLWEGCYEGAGWMMVVVMMIMKVLQVPIFGCYAKYFINTILLYSHRTPTNGKSNAYS